MQKQFATLPHQRLERAYHSAKPSATHYGGPHPSDFSQRQIESEIEAYKDAPTRERLIRIHDLLERHGFELDSEYRVNPEFTRMSGMIREHMTQAGYFQKIVDRWTGVPPERLFMWQHDADHLVAFARKQDGEIGGGARLVPAGRRGYRIEPIYSTAHRMRLSVPFYIEPFLSSGSDLFWHIHPQGIPHVLSHDDLLHSRRTGVPTMVTGITPEGRAATEINIGNARHPVRIVPRPFHGLFSLIEKVLGRA